MKAEIRFFFPKNVSHLRGRPDSRNVTPKRSGNRCAGNIVLQKKALTGRNNRLIPANLKRLKRSEVPFVVRIPVIPGVNDESDNLEMLAELLSGTENLREIQFLPYNPAAPAKYSCVGRKILLNISETPDIRCLSAIFRQKNLPYRTL